MAQKLLVFDVGGSSVKYATFEDALMGRGSFPIRGEVFDEFLADIDDVIRERWPVDGIAFSLPGKIDPVSGLAHTGGAVSCLYGANLKSHFEEARGVPVAVMNDAKCAALAELGYGALRDVRDAVVVVFGTGIGGALIVNGELVLGSHLTSGELSSFTDNITDMGGEQWQFWYQCGIDGLSRAVEEASGVAGLGGVEVFERIREGDQKVEEGLRIFCRRAAWHLYNLQLVTDPEVFAIGGGISDEPLFLDYLSGAVDELAGIVPQYFAKPRLVSCEFRADANLVGAAYAFQRQMRM